MKTPTSPDRAAERYRFITDEFAAQLRITTQAVRKRFSQTGSFYGIRPLRLPNGRLLWPDDALEQLLANTKSEVRS